MILAAGVAGGRSAGPGVLYKSPCCYATLLRLATTHRHSYHKPHSTTIRHQHTDPPVCLPLLVSTLRGKVVSIFPCSGRGLHICAMGCISSRGISHTPDPGLCLHGGVVVAGGLRLAGHLHVALTPGATTALGQVPVLLIMRPVTVT